MTASIRVIPRLDIKGPNLIKGIEFEGNRVLGHAAQFAKYYYEAGADELIYQDVVASLYRRNSLLDIIKETASEIFIPLTVAGGIRSLEDAKEILRAGADKIAINTAATENPSLITEIANVFGRQCVVSSIEAYYINGRYQVWTDYGREVTKLDAVEWAKQVADRGAGEILLTSINRDGTGKGYDLELINAISSVVDIPVVASGGAGSVDDFFSAIDQGGANAVAAASIFHYEHAEPVDRAYMSFYKDALRKGEPIDSGNIEFLNGGYGNYRDFFVTPCSIHDVKTSLRNKNYKVRIDGADL